MRLSQLGYRVLAGCLTKQAVLELSGQKNVTAFELDVTSERDRASLSELLARTCPDTLAAVINNAGISDGFLVEWTSPAVLRRVMEINFFAPVAISQLTLPYLRRSHGRLVNVASVAGFFAAANMGAYAASKHAIAAISDSLRGEIRAMGVAVSIIMPGFARTPILASGDANIQRVYAESASQKRQPNINTYVKHFSHPRAARALPAQLARARVHSPQALARAGRRPHAHR